MRKGFAAACILVLATAAAPIMESASAQGANQPGWTYAYVDGVATATERNERGDVVATLTCRPPEGDIIITDNTFNDRRVERANRADVRIGVMSVNVPATVERVRGRGRRYSVSIHLPQRPPILAAVQERDQLSVTIAGMSRTYATGGPAKMEEVAYACWQ